MMKVFEAMTKKVITLDVETNISEALAKMRDNNIHTIPLVKNGKYVSVLSYREILRRRSIQPSSKVLHFSVPSPGLEQDWDLMDAARKLQESGLLALPVLKKEKVTGILSRTDLMQHLGEIFNIRNLSCGDLMTADPERVMDSDSVESAVDKMRGQSSSEIPCIDETGKYTGLVRLEDTTKETVSSGQKLRSGQYPSRRKVGPITCGSVARVMTPLRMENKLEEASDLMSKERVHVAPIVDSTQKLVGIVDMNVIVDAVAGSSGTDGVLVNLSGLEPGEEDLYDVAYFLADKFLQRFHRLTGLKNGTLNINVQKYKGEGRTKYSVRTRLLSGRISMAVDSHSWNFAECISEIFDDYEKRLTKKKERS